jgi:hypothetical protein
MNAPASIPAQGKAKRGPGRPRKVSPDEAPKTEAKGPQPPADSPPANPPEPPAEVKAPQSVPDKPRFYVHEVAELVAPIIKATPAAARSRLYRRIERGSVRATRYLGTLMISRDEAKRIVEGERA